MAGIKLQNKKRYCENCKGETRIMAGLSASGLKTQIRSYTETDSNVLTDLF